MLWLLLLIIQSTCLIILTAILLILMLRRNRCSSHSIISHILHWTYMRQASWSFLFVSVSAVLAVSFIISYMIRYINRIPSRLRNKRYMLFIFVYSLIFDLTWSDTVFDGALDTISWINRSCRTNRCLWEWCLHFSFLQTTRLRLQLIVIRFWKPFCQLCKILWHFNCIK